MNQTKKTALLAILFLYTVICGILIADIGTSSIAGSSRGCIFDFIMRH
ncbi:MAG: hypothetical protein M0R40_05735 [Firmicutes bacterium]|nr:hypothetical protein [Bacillota bacterium]